MRVGLVLGAGGVQGGAWLVGGLAALAEETGWDPATADFIVGTSAGSMVGSLLAAGLPPWFMVAHSAGESFDGMADAQGRQAADADRTGGAVFRFDPDHRVRFREAIKNLIGECEFECLEEKAHSMMKFTRSEMNEMIEGFKIKLKKLKKP